MRYKLLTAAALSTVALLLGACAGNPQSPAGSGTPAQQQALARYSAFAGPSLTSFTWLGKFWSWEPLSKNQLVVYTTPNDAYLLKVWPPCDMRFASLAIGISSTASTVYAHMDSIVVRGGGAGPLTCPIDSIRRVDIARMNAAPHQPPAPDNPAAPPAGSAPPASSPTPSPNPQR
jgi:hypothetical protein